MKIVGGKWTNWSGSVTCKPRQVIAPKDEVELAAAIRSAEAPVRVPGTGHSFTPLCKTDGMLVDMAAFTGLKRMDKANLVATFAAATPLWAVGPALHAEGAALKNMGDIDRQTVAGVVGTGTHGTGQALGSFSAEVAGFRIILASGEVLNCTPEENAEIFAAGRCALGALGVMTEVSIRVRPAYRLVQKIWLLPPDELFRQLDALVAANRHFEFFWFPYADIAICKTLNETDGPAPEPHSAGELRKRGEAVGIDMRLFATINEVLRYAPFLLKPAHRLLTQLMSASARPRWSYEIFPSPRPIRFNEMEYALPYTSGADCVREIAEMVRRKHIGTGFPIEFRTVAADDVWLSPFYGRASATVAVHQYHRVDSAPLFNACEAIFRTREGRPHWGKCHTRTADELSALYPEFDRFRALRSRLDPNGKFLNGYLRALLP